MARRARETSRAEIVIAETKSGVVHMILRTKDGKLWRFISRDQGESWSAAEKTGLIFTSSASPLLCTRNGTLVLTDNTSPYPLRLPLVKIIRAKRGSRLGLKQNN